MSFSLPRTIGEYLKHFADELGDRVVEQFHHCINRAMRRHPCCES